MTDIHIYLDYNATTPVSPVVLEAMMPFFTERFANASSVTHRAGRESARAVEKAREQVAALMGCEPAEIVFTSGSTESLNLAIKGVAKRYLSKGRKIITWETEHKAVLDVCSRLETEGMNIIRLPVNRSGLPDLEELIKNLDDQCVMMIMMLANNETGTIMPVAEAAQRAHEAGCLVVCDATQAAGKIKLDVQQLQADLVCISAHKMYGPKGTGALFVRRKNPRVSLLPLIDGGGHEKGLRSGTLNVPGIVGMGAAAAECLGRQWDDASRMSELRTLLEQQLTDDTPFFINGSVRDRLPNTTNICFKGFKASSIINLLPLLAVSTGSACSSALPEPSHVLKSLGLSEEEAYSSIRFSLGRDTTREEITEVVQWVKDALHRLSLPPS
jgi:cysteine desulfurase